MASEDESDSSEENIFLVCNHCSEVFDEETEFNKHLTTYHPSDAPQLSCKTCGLGFKVR